MFLPCLQSFFPLSLSFFSPFLFFFFLVGGWARSLYSMELSFKMYTVPRFGRNMNSNVVSNALLSVNGGWGIRESIPTTIQTHVEHCSRQAQIGWVGERDSRGSRWLLTFECSTSLSICSVSSRHLADTVVQYLSCVLSKDQTLIYQVKVKL